MEPEEMRQRQKAALGSLQAAIDELGPITDAAPGIVREPVLDVVDSIQEAGEELKSIEFSEEDNEDYGRN